MFIEINHVPFNEGQFVRRLFDDTELTFRQSIINLSAINRINLFETTDDIFVAQIDTAIGCFHTTQEEFERIRNIMLDAGILRIN